jgi:hypothetical protein
MQLLAEWTAQDEILAAALARQQQGSQLPS